MARSADVEPSDREHHPQAGDNSTAESFGEDASVVQCIEIAREIIDEQRARNRHLDAKTGTLAGFSATVLTLNATLGRPLLQDPDLSARADVFVSACFAVTLLALTAAVVLAVLGVLSPKASTDLTEKQIDQYSDRPKVVTAPEALRLTWLRTLTDMAKSDRRVGNAKAKHANRAAKALATGLVGVAGQALTLVVT